MTDLEISNLVGKQAQCLISSLYDYPPNLNALRLEALEMLVSLLTDSFSKFYIANLEDRMSITNSSTP